MRGLGDTSVDRFGQGTELVDRANHAMSEVVAVIGEVIAMVAGISTASAEQSSGVSQVGKALTQMDQTVGA